MLRQRFFLGSLLSWMLMLTFTIICSSRSVVAFSTRPTFVATTTPPPAARPLSRVVFHSTTVVTEEDDVTSSAAETKDETKSSAVTKETAKAISNDFQSKSKGSDEKEIFSSKETKRKAEQPSAKTAAVADETTTPSQKAPAPTEDDAPPRLDLPWNDVQKWALMDQLPKYTIQIQDENTMKVLTLWRTLSNEVVELSGYPLPFLVERQMELQKQQQRRESKEGLTTKTSRTILPYLDDYEFTAAGGLLGAVYGVPGVADGTRIETTPVGDVQSTLPKGYIRVAGSVLYELGQPREVSDVFATTTTTTTNTAVEVTQSLVKKGAQRSVNTASQIVENPPAVDPELVQLGMLTGMVVAGAAAIESLSHHLTVNVFWV